MLEALRLWRETVGVDDLVVAAAAVKPGDVAGIARLRKRWSADHVHIALELARGRRAASRKFPGRAEDLLCDGEAAEQASGWRVARHKAQRFADRVPGGDTVLDLCSGMGGDTMALADAGLRVLAFDLSPARAWMTARNARCPAAALDVTALPLDDAWLHLDPARRDDAGRVWRMADYQPGPAFIARCLTAAAGAGIKLGPGVDLAELPEGDYATEFISEAGRLVQAVLWSGDLRLSTSRAASAIDADGAVHTLAGEPTDHYALPTCDDAARPDRYIFTTDPCVERAGLLGALCEATGLVMLHPQLGLLTGDVMPTHPMLTAFEVHTVMPWRMKKAAAWLREHGAGLVEVKTRGQAVDTDQTQRQLRGPGEVPYVIFLHRIEARIQCLIAQRRLPPSRDGEGL